MTDKMRRQPLYRIGGEGFSQRGSRPCTTPPEHTPLRRRLELRLRLERLIKRQQKEEKHEIKENIYIYTRTDM